MPRGRRESVQTPTPTEIIAESLPGGIDLQKGRENRRKRLKKEEAERKARIQPALSRVNDRIVSETMSGALGRQLQHMIEVGDKLTVEYNLGRCATEMTVGDIIGTEAYRALAEACAQRNFFECSVNRKAVPAIVASDEDAREEEHFFLRVSHKSW